MQNKTGLVISREYFSRVKKKSFLLTTILVPVIIIAFYAVIIAISLQGSSEKPKLAVIDEAGLLVNNNVKDSEIVIIKNETEASFIKKYRKQGYNAFLYIPKLNLDSPAGILLHSKSQMSLSATLSAERKINRAIENERLKASGINAGDYDKIASDINIDPRIDTETGSKKSVAGIAYGVSFACGIMIYMMMILYGTQVMRGVSEEKNSRIAEVIVSSVKPFQLMTGKIIGIGAVGLTQFIIWITLVLAMQMLLPLIFPHMLDSVNAAGSDAVAGASAANILQGFSSLPLLKIGSAFLFYFLAGYLTYASLFAAVGSMATDDQQDTQQLIFPILMPIILGFVIMTKAVSDPNSSLAVFGSLFPLTSPIVMMGRITYDVPTWQILLSATLLIGCFLFLAWVSAKIYRTGILMYGKKASWKEMIKWAVKKS